MIARISELEAERDGLRESNEWKHRRLDLMQRLQVNFAEPERTIVCDVLANGSLLPDPKGSRYGGKDRLGCPCGLDSYRPIHHSACYSCRQAEMDGEP